MTAVDYLVEQLQKEYKWFPSTQSELILEAKEMERNQIIRAINYSEMKRDELKKQAIEQGRTIGEIYYEKIFI
jgi:hypothetical protein